MKCPVDETELAITDRQGIEIDYCPKCRGVWLDRGELDKLIERSAATIAPQPAPTREREQREREYRQRDSDEYHRRKRKKSLLGEIFDF